MPRPIRSLILSVRDEHYAVLKYPPQRAVPAWATRGVFFSITRTAEELSLVTARANVPAGEAIVQEWSAMKVHGPFPFSETGVLASLAGPLAEAGIGIFVISTFDTDYLLVDARECAEAKRVLQAAGHGFVDGDFVFEKAKENVE